MRAFVGVDHVSEIFLKVKTMLFYIPKFDIKFLIIYEIDKCWSFYIWLWIYYQETVVNEFTVFATIWMWRILIELPTYVFGDKSLC